MDKQYQAVKLGRVHHQVGSALFISLIILFMLTVLGLSSMNQSIMELKISSNIQERAIAYQSTLAGLDATMCLVDSDEDPFRKDYSINANISDGTSLELQFQSDSSTELDAFKDQGDSNISLAVCSINNGQIHDGTANTIGSVTGETQTVRIKQVAHKVDCPREVNASSSGDIKCHQYIVRSQYQYTTTDASVSTWAGISRQVPAD